MDPKEQYNGDLDDVYIYWFKIVKTDLWIVDLDMVISDNKTKDEDGEYLAKLPLLLVQDQE